MEENREYAMIKTIRLLIEEHGQVKFLKFLSFELQSIYQHGQLSKRIRHRMKNVIDLIDEYERESQEQYRKYTGTQSTSST